MARSVDEESIDSVHPRISKSSAKATYVCRVGSRLASGILKDGTRLRDLIEVGLVDSSWCSHLPAELRSRSALLDIRKTRAIDCEALCARFLGPLPMKMWTISKHKLKLWMFWMGLVLEAITFLSDKEARLPWIAHIFDPSGLELQRAAERLEQKGWVGPNDKELATLEALFLDALRPLNPEPGFAGIKVESFRLKPEQFNWNKGLILHKPLEVQLSSGQDFDVPGDFLRNLINERKDRKSFLTSVVLYCLGTLLVIVSFYMEAPPAEKVPYDMERKENDHELERRPGNRQTA